MRKLIVMIMLSSVWSWAFACPSGYRDGEGQYCYQIPNFSEKTVMVKVGNDCPQGYHDGKGAYCYGGSEAERVIVKVGGNCPKGYKDGRGTYCYP